MSYISFSQVSKTFANRKEPSLFPTSLSIEKGECVVIVGTSGSGKTTLLKLVNGLLTPTSGEVWIDHQNIKNMDIQQLRHQIGYVMQQSGLFPHMTIEENMKLVLSLLKWEKEAIDRRMDELFTLIQLERKQYGKRYPSQLSGGQQQRIALARALAMNPRILLMDEPFSALDSITRKSMQLELKEIQRQLHQTILFVTHDLEEAFLLGDRIVIMDEGRIVESGTPQSLVQHANHPFTRQLLHDNYALPFFQLMTVEQMMEPTTVEGGPSVFVYDRLLSCLPYLSAYHRINVVNQDNHVVGSIDCAYLQQMLAGNEVGVLHG